MLGEAFAVILNNTEHIEEYTKSIINLCTKKTVDFEDYPPTTDEIIEIADELCKCSNNNVNDMDSLILAHAIANNEAVYFFTKDKELKPRIFIIISKNEKI